MDPERTSPVRVDQVGYLPDAPKVGMVVADAVAGDAFVVRSTDDGATAYEGTLGEPIVDPTAGHTVRRARFDDLDEPGTYELAVGDATSPPFVVGPDVYDDVLRNVGRLYALKRCNQRVEDPETGLTFGPGHPQDHEAMVTATDDPVYDEGDVLDVSGGWYDAGDYGKYAAPGAVTVGAKLWAYQRNPDAFAVGQYDYPATHESERTGRMPDALVEIAWKLDWLERMQRTDGALWSIVAGSEWPDFVRPTEDDQQRHVFGLSSAITAMGAAVFANAARVYRDQDPAFADRMLANAEDAFAWLEENPDLVWREDPDQDAGSGPYARGAEYEDPERFDGRDLERYDRFWAAAELFHTTGEGRYHDYLEEHCGDVFGVTPPAFDWHTGLPMGQYAYATAEGADPERRQEIVDAFERRAHERAAQVASDGYHTALSTDEYRWASTREVAAHGVLLALADDLTDGAYRDAALEQLHYVLGRTPTGYSYVTGAGTVAPEHPHDRIVASTDALLPGMVVGGPNDDRVWAHDGLTPEDVPLEDPGTAQLYLDEQPSFHTNEWAINYSAPVFWLLAEATDD